MHPQLLERATHGFKCGYWHARDRRPPRFTVDDGTFAAHDYLEGWNAFMNEQYWDAVRENEQRDRAAKEAEDRFIEAIDGEGWRIS